MQGLNSISNRVAGRAAIVAGIASVATGTMQVIHSQRHAGSKVVGLDGHLTLAFFALFLIAVAPGFVALARYGRSALASKAAVAAAAGTGLLGLTCISSVINGKDLGVFPALAGVTNLAWIAGSVLIAVSLTRARRVPRAIAIGLPVTWILAVPLGTVGGGLVAAAYFLAVGLLLRNDAIERAGRLVPAFARN